MAWTYSKVAWVAALISLFALLRGLRGLVEVDDRPVALVVAVVVVAVTGLVPSTLGRGQVLPEQAGWRKTLQFFGASAATVLAVLLGVDVVLAGVVGVAAAAVVPLAWRAPQS
ncbi:hypothetical protein ACQE98_12845 [Ornithinimicrobium sp. W1679]|uniref:hypothetical protein n=1 Tax=unclassified Ornithinimicrobium TaxID=2615080 RepID=UPI003CE98862